MSGKSILFVDDELEPIRCFANIFRKTFENIYLASDGLKGFEAYKEHRPDIIVSDVTMPNCDGFRMLSMIRELNPDVKIIFATAHTEEELLETIEALGAMYVTKPINVVNLRKMIFGLLEELD
jgi:CheY-like chemotaxis protein